MKYEKTDEVLERVGPGDVWFDANDCASRITVNVYGSVCLECLPSGTASWYSTAGLGPQPWYRARLVPEWRSADEAAKWALTHLDRVLVPKEGSWAPRCLARSGRWLVHGHGESFGPSGKTRWRPETGTWED